MSVEKKMFVKNALSWVFPLTIFDYQVYSKLAKFLFPYINSI